MAFNIQKIIDKYLLGLIVLIKWPFFRLMRVKSQKNSKFSRVAFIKLWAIGDSVITLPIIKAFKTKYPHTKITVIARKSNAQVYRNQDFIDELVLFESNNFGTLLKSFRKYDLCIDMEPYLNISALLAAYTGKDTIGFSHGIRSLLYGHKTSFNKNQHIVKSYFSMVEIFGVKTIPKKLVKLEYSRDVENKIRKLLANHKLSKNHKLIGMMPGVGPNVREREWPKFKELCIEILKRRIDVKIVLFGGTEDYELNEYVKSGNSRIINVAGGTSIEQVFFLIEKMTLFVSNDTGLMHIAAAQGVPTIGLFGPNTPKIWAPYGPRNISIFHPKPGCPFLDNTSHNLVPSRLTKDQKTCMDAISVGEVLKEVLKRI